MLFLRSVIHSLLHLTHILSFFIKLSKNTFTTEMETVFALRGWKVKPCMACSQGLLPDCQVTWYTEGEWHWPKCCFLHTTRVEKWVKWEPPAQRKNAGAGGQMVAPERSRNWKNTCSSHTVSKISNRNKNSAFP